MVRVKTNTKYMIKIITTSLVMVLMSVFMAIGIWASPSELSTISSVISFLATDVDVNLVGVVSGSEVPVETFQTNISNEEYDEVSKSWNLERLMFNNSTKAPITIGIAIRNNSEETKPYIQTNVFGNIPSNIRVKYSQIGGENANPYSQTVSKNDFSSAIISSLQSECFETSTNGLSVPEYNPLVINNLTQGKVYYYQVEFSIIDKSKEVESFCLDLGITLKSKKTDSIYQIESKKDSSSPSEGGNCGYEVIENSENESRIKFVAEVKEGYEFDGWYVKDNSNNVSDRVSSNPIFEITANADVTYYAKWKIARKVNFVVDGINKGEATYSSGTVSDFASAYEPSPYSTGWFLNEELTKVAKDDFLSTDTETSPITLYCRTASITGLTFTLASDGNSYLVAGESSTSPSGEVVLPNKYDGKPVSGFVAGTISSPTFKKNTNITSVVLSNNITAIADDTFKDSTKITNVTIPNCVTKINYQAFYGCISLISIEIPESITSIGIEVFSYCSSLTGIVVASENTIYDSRNNCNAIIDTSSSYLTGEITDRLIVGCKNTIIPNSVTGIGGYAFKGCKDLTSIQIPDSVISIGEYAFKECTSLTEVELPNSVTGIGVEAFSYCSNLTSVKIPNSLNHIGTNAFSYCTSLIKIFIPKTVTTIYAKYSDWATFYGCSSNLVIYCEASSKPGGWADYWNYRTNSAIHTTYWGKTYEDCYPVEYSVTVGKYSLSPNAGCSYSVSPSTILSTGTEVTYKAIVSDGYRFMGWYDSSSGGELVSNNETYVTTLYEPTTYYAYWQLAQDINIVVDSKTTQVPYYAGKTIASTIKSYEPTYFTGWFLDSGLTQIATTSFLQETSFEGSLLTLYCKTASITGLVFTLTDDGNSYLVACESSTSPSGNIVIPNNYNGKPVIGFASGSQSDPAFKKNANITSVTLPSSITSVGNYAFYTCTAITNINIPNSVLTIGYYSFGYCSALVEIVLPNTVTSIDAMAFSDCRALEKAVLPTGIKAIERYTFWTCSSLTSITIPDAVETIGMSAFNKCFKLTSLRIPKNVKSIGTGAFQGCGNVTSIVVDSSNTVYDSRNNCNAIIETATNTLIQGCNYTTIPNTVTSIGGGSFINMDKITSMTIPNSVVTIGSSVFTYCSGLTSITLSTNLTSIGAGAFVYCTGLTKIFIPKSVTTITAESSNTYPFKNCNSTLKIYCEASSKPSGFGTYWNYYDNYNALTTYWGASSTDVTGTLDKLTFTLTSDGNSYSVKAKNTSISGKVVIPDTYNEKPVTEIASSAFSGCGSLTEIIIPDSITTIGSFAFELCTSMKKIFIPKSVTTIVASAASYLPFNRCSTILTIYCEVSSKPSGWGIYWNNRTNSAKFTPQWGYTREQYNAV